MSGISIRGNAGRGIVTRGVVTRGIAGVGAPSFPTLEDLLQWLYASEAPSTVLDRTPPKYPANYVESTYLAFNGVADEQYIPNCPLSPTLSMEILFSWEYTKDERVGGSNTSSAFYLKRLAGSTVQAVIGASSDFFNVTVNSTGLTRIRIVGNGDVYKDGVWVGNTGGSVTSTGGEIYIGALYSSTLDATLLWASIRVAEVIITDCGHYTYSQGAGLIIEDVSGRGNHSTITTTDAASLLTMWSANTQDGFHYNIFNGFTLFVNATPLIIRRPYDEDGNPIAGAPPAGYTLISENPPYGIHNGAETKILQDATVLDLNGTSTKVVYAANETYNIGTADFELTARINLDTIALINAIYSHYDDVEGIGLYIYVGDDGFLSVVDMQFGGAYSAAALAIDTEYDIRIVKSGTAYTVYVDGVAGAIGSTSAADLGDTSGVDVAVGVDDPYTACYFNGIVADLVVKIDGTERINSRLNEGTGTVATNNGTGANGTITDPVWVNDPRFLQSGLWSTDGINYVAVSYADFRAWISGNDDTWVWSVDRGGGFVPIVAALTYLYGRGYTYAEALRLIRSFKDNANSQIEIVYDVNDSPVIDVDGEVVLVQP